MSDIRHKIRVIDLHLPKSFVAQFIENMVKGDMRGPPEDVLSTNTSFSATIVRQHHTNEFSHENKKIAQISV